MNATAVPMMRPLRLPEASIAALNSQNLPMKSRMSVRMRSACALPLAPARKSW